MIGVILAAGVGSRLRPITDDKPKSLARAAGREILRYQLDSYKQAGITSIVIIVGYEGDAICEYVKHEKALDIRIVWNRDYETTNNMYSLYLAREFIHGQAFILNNADLTIDPAVVPLLAHSANENLIAVDEGTFNPESMKIVVDQGGRITSIAKTITEADAYGCSIDFYKFSAHSSAVLLDAITHIVEDDHNLKDWTELAIDRLLKDGSLTMHPAPIGSARWVEVDNFDDLAAADRLFSDVQTILGDADLVFCDMDGTLYTGSDMIPGADRFIAALRGADKKLYVLSNNSSRNKSEYVHKLKGFGIDVDEDRIILSTDGLVDYLHQQGVSHVYTVGTDALCQRLASEDIEPLSSKPEYVVVGYDTELNYTKLRRACQFLNQSVDMLATHSDTFCPTPTGPVPDCGAIVELLTRTTGVKPVRTFGKPDTDFLMAKINGHAANPSRVVVIGDRLYTDMELAHRLRCKSILVLSGETTRTAVEREATFPDVCVNSVADLTPYLQRDTGSGATHLEPAYATGVATAGCDAA